MDEPSRFSNALNSSGATARGRSCASTRRGRARSRFPTRTGQPRLASWYGNGLLWAGLTADGIYAVAQDRVAEDGSIGNKLLWATTPPERAPTLSGERLDAPAPPLRVLGVNRGSFSSADKPSYMSPVSFPTAGCWRLTARVADVSLTYVVEVVVRTAPTP